MLTVFHLAGQRFYYGVSSPEWPTLMSAVSLMLPLADRMWAHDRAAACLPPRTRHPCRSAPRIHTHSASMDRNQDVEAGLLGPEAESSGCSLACVWAEVV